MDIIVEHPKFGFGEILEIGYDTGKPLVSVLWDNGQKGCCWVEELEFIERENKMIRIKEQLLSDVNRVFRLEAIFDLGMIFT